MTASKLQRCLVMSVLGVMACNVDAGFTVTSKPALAEVPGAHAGVLSVPTVTIVSKRLPRHVLIVGDSEACTVGPYVRTTVALINQENDEPRDDVHVACKGGTVVQYWGAGGHMQAALREFPHPDDILIFLGTNHYWQKQAPTTASITNFLDSADCIWVGNTAVHGQHWAINGLIRDAVTPRCTYFDTEAADISLADGVHPTPAGAVRWLRLVWATIPPKYEETHE
jgi:hypothetical protein